jgi:MFS superfamily sulfate permease-like transporter
MGMTVGVFNILMQNYRADFVLEERTDDRFVLRLSEHVSFLNKASIVRGLGDVPAGSRVIIDGTGSVAIDPDVLEVIRDFRLRVDESDIAVELRGIGGLDALPAAAERRSP